MPVFKFHSFRGEKSALLLLSRPFCYGQTPVYVPKKDLPDTIVAEDVVAIEAGFILIDMIDVDTGEVRTAGDGSPLKVLSY